MEAWNPYKFTNATEVVTLLVLLMLLVILSGVTVVPLRHRRRVVIWPLVLFWVFTILSATYFGRLETENGSLRLELFWTIKKAWSEHQGLYWYYIIGNILLFIPLGFLLPLADEQLAKGLFTTLVGAGLSLFVEITQYVTGTGLCELDDLFHNTLGTFTGYQCFVVFYCLMDKLRSIQDKGRRFDKHSWGLSLAYLIGLCLLFFGLLSINKPDWAGVFH